MKIYFLTCAMFLCVTIYSQDFYKIQPTKYDSFIQSPDVKWALRINANYLLKTNAFNLWDYLHNKWIKDSLKVYRRDSIKNYKSYKKGFDEKFDSDINESKRIFTIQAVAGMKDSNKYVQADQIFFMKENNLLSVVVSANISFPFVLSTGDIVHYTPTFYSCLNEHAQYNFSKNGCIDLGINSLKLGFNEEGFAMINIEDFANREDFSDYLKLKEMYSQDLPDVLWNLILKNKVKFIDINTGLYISSDSLETHTFYPDYVQKNFGKDGRVIDSVIIKRYFIPSQITSIKVYQHFYFDTINNLLYSTISSLDLFVRDIENYSFNHREIYIGKVEF